MGGGVFEVDLGSHINIRPHPLALTIAPAPVGCRPCWVFVRRVLSWSLFVRAADAEFARSAAGFPVVPIALTSRFDFGRASWFATARFAWPACSPSRSVFPSFVVSVFDSTQRQASAAAHTIPLAPVGCSAPLGLMINVEPDAPLPGHRFGAEKCPDRTNDPNDLFVVFRELPL